MSLDDELSKRIKYVVSMAQEIPFYKRKFKELNIDPQKIKMPEDLLEAYQKGLCTTGKDLQDIVTSYRVFRQYFLTSGTGGKPKIVAMTSDDTAAYNRRFKMALKDIIKENDVILNCLPWSPAVSGKMMNDALSLFPVQIFHSPAQILSDATKFMAYKRMFKPNVLISLTTFAYRLPRKLEENSIDAKTLGLKSIIIGGEPSTLERRKMLGKEFNASVYDWYASSESGLMAYEYPEFSGEYTVTLPETLIFVVKGNYSVSVGENGDILVTNLPNIGERPHMVLLNYRIGDWARCLEKRDDEVVTLIGDVRRWAAYLAGAKLDPTELEKIIEDLRAEGVGLTGEYAVINYYDEERRAVAEVRMEIAKSLTLQEREEVERKIREKIYESNIPVRTMVEEAKDARLIIKLTTPGKLYQGYEHLIKPGKPRRLLTIQ